MDACNFLLALDCLFEDALLCFVNVCGMFMGVLCVSVCVYGCSVCFSMCLWVFSVFQYVFMGAPVAGFMQVIEKLEMFRESHGKLKTGKVMKMGKLGKTGKFTGDWKSHEKLENSWQLVQILSRKTGTLMIWKTESSRKVKKQTNKQTKTKTKKKNQQQTRVGENQESYGKSGEVIDNREIYGKLGKS